MRAGTKSPCFGCVARGPGSHGRCEAYEEFARQNKERREAARKAAAIAYGVKKSFVPKYKKNKRGGEG